MESNVILDEGSDELIRVIVALMTAKCELLSLRLQQPHMRYKQWKTHV